MRVELNVNVGAEDDLRELMGRPPGASVLDLGEPLKVLPSGVYFAPDPHAWELLEPSEQNALAPPRGLGESVVADGVSPHWRRVLSFPFTGKQLLQFAEFTLLPELCQWMERDRTDPAFEQLLSGSPRVLALAHFLAGGEDPDLQTEAETPAHGAGHSCPSALAETRGAIADAVEAAARPASPTTLHKIGRDELSSVLAAAVLAAAERPSFTAGEVGPVWTQLLKLAREVPPRHPLVGVRGNEVQYHKGNGVSAITRKMLGDRLRRAKARNGS